MNKFKLSALVLATSFALTACGGGGGGGGSNSTTQQEQTINTTTQTSTTTTTTTTGVDFPAVNIPSYDSNTLRFDKDNYALGSIIDSPIKNIEGKTLANFVGTNRPYSVHGVIVWSENGADNMTQKLIELGSSYSVNTATNLANIQGQGMVDAMNNTFRGATAVPYRTIFYMGFPTPAQAQTITDENGNKTTTYIVPTTLKGTATYKGDAVRYDTLSLRARHIGETTLTVDFDNKKISGKINTDDYRRNIELKETTISATEPTETQAANITFSGTAEALGNHFYKTTSGTYQGRFYGPNAEEAAGFVRFGTDGDSITAEDSTSFSAVKQ